MRKWNAVIYVPEGTGYQGGEFHDHVAIHFETKYNSPQIKMKTNVNMY